MNPIRVLLVDDSQQFLTVTQVWLSDVAGTCVVGAFLSARSALGKIGELRPDVILMDVFMPEMNGLEATALIKAQRGAPRVIIVSMEDYPSLRTAAEARGADGFIPKTYLPTRLEPLLRQWFQ